MATVAYARVSSIGQSLEVQLDALKHCDIIFQEKLSGMDNSRPQLSACLKYLRKGDTLIITRLDRLARSTLHLMKIADELKEQGIELHVLEQNIDTRTSTGRLLFGVIAIMAQFETELRRERQSEGVQKALANGVQFGAKPKLTPEEQTQLVKDKDSGMSVKDLCSQYGIGPASVHRIVKAEKVKAEPVDGEGV